MRGRWIFLVLLGVLAGCGSAGQSGGAASCAATVRWRATTYVGYGAGHRPPRGKPLGRGVIPACRDTNHPSAVDHDTSVAVRAIRGVDPRLAIVLARDPRELYVNRQKLNPARLRAMVKRFRGHG